MMLKTAFYLSKNFVEDARKSQSCDSQLLI
jgi:hypothetical protein